MANRDGDPLRAIQLELWPIVGSFVIDGASAVSSQNPTSTSVLTVTKPAGTGIYQVALADAWPDILYANATLLVAAGTLDRDIKPIVITPSTGVVQFQVRKSSDGTAVDPVSMTVLFEIVCKNSSVTP
jgi:hypothetical protein